MEKTKFYFTGEIFCIRYVSRAAQSGREYRTSRDHDLNLKPIKCYIKGACLSVVCGQSPSIRKAGEQIRIIPPSS